MECPQNIGPYAADALTSDRTSSVFFFQRFFSQAVILVELTMSNHDEMLPALPEKPFVGWTEAFYDIYFATKRTIDAVGYPTFTKMAHDFKTYAVFSYDDFYVFVLLAIALTFLRYIMTYAFFLPIGRWLRLKPANLSKWPESLWKGFFYLFAWIYQFYVIIWSGKYTTFQRPQNMFIDWKPRVLPENDLYWAYMIQLGFYVHSIYATLMMDAWRKDSIVMLFHHFLTITLLWCSLACGFIQIGVCLVMLHDLNDVLLEFCKINVYLKDRNGKFYWINDFLSSVGFVALTVSWFYCRIYLFPVKILHAGAYGTWVSCMVRPIPFFMFFNPLIWILQGLNVYWFSFLVIFLVRVVQGQITEVEDVREEADEPTDAKLSQSDRKNQ